MRHDNGITLLPAGRKTIRERIKGLLKSRNGQGGTHGN